MVYAEITFWACLFFIAYTYLLYPLLLFQAYTFAQIWRDVFYLSRRCSTRASDFSDAELPRISLIIAAHNEESVIAERIANLRAIDYPQDKLEVVLVSDGSSDGTNAILACAQAPHLQKIFLPVRGGKANAINHGVEASQHEVLVFSDASTYFAADTVRKLVRHFQNSRVGAVCGSLHFKAAGDSEHTEGIYWKYESMLRLMEARLGATLTASGSVYAIRRECFRRMAPGTIVEDFVVPMNCRKAGYQVVYDPEAVATDVAASTVKGEFTRRVRLAVGSFKAFRELSRTPLDGLTCVAFFSHKVLRWVLPFFLVGLLASNIFLAAREPYTLALVCQGTFYFAALMGMAFHGKNPAGKFAALCYYLVAIHLAFAVGFIRLLLGREQGVWQKVR